MVKVVASTPDNMPLASGMLHSAAMADTMPVKTEAGEQTARQQQHSRYGHTPAQLSTRDLHL
jgi:hypothetical protein